MISRTIMSKSVSLTVALLLAIVAGGCASPASETSSTGAASKLLTVFWKGSEQAGINALVAQYKKDHPDMQVLVTTAETETYQATIRTQLAAGSAPDVVFVWPGNGNPAAIQQLAPGGNLADLSSEPWASKYPAQLMPLSKVGGKTYIMMPIVTAFGIAYNVPAMEAAGLVVPTTWDAVLTFCDAAKAKGKVAFALGANTLNNTQNILYNLVPTLVYGPTPSVNADLAAGKTTFATQPGWVEAMGKYKLMIDRKCFSDNATGLTQNDQVKAVASGDAMGMATLAFNLNSLVAAAPKTEFAFYPLPANNDPTSEMMATSSAGGAGVYANGKNKAAAIAFVEYLATPAGMKIYNDALVGAVPSIPSGATYTLQAQQVINQYLTSGKISEFLNQSWPNAKIEQAMYSGVQGMLGGAMTPAQVLEGMDAVYK